MLSAARMLARGRTAVIVNRTSGTTGSDVIATISLAGSADAQRFTDVRPHRIGSRNAIVTRGRGQNRPATSALPVIDNILPPDNMKLPTDAQLAKLADAAGCTNERSEGFTKDEAFALSKRNGTDRTLVLIACGSGAYNFNSKIFVGSRFSNEAKGNWAFTPARFDYVSQEPSNPATATVLVNAFFDTEKGVLGSYAKGLGLGDCGNSESYVWDGDMFRMTEAATIPECRSVWQWPVIWRARIAHNASAEQNEKIVQK